MSTSREASSTIRIKGQEVRVGLLTIGDRDLVISSGFPRLCQIKDEWYHDVDDVHEILDALRARPGSADLFTFIDRPPRLSNYEFYKESDNVAALELTNYDHWWKTQLNSAARGHVRKSAKSGVHVRVTQFDEILLRGIEQIYDETPLRQGKPFWHYRRGLDYLREVHRTFPDRSDFLGAYLGDELVGFIKLVYAGETASLMHIISKNAHRDKAVTNGLLAKAVEVSCEREIRYLMYDKYDYPVGGSASLLLFKKNNGFVKLEYPRYFVPLTRRGAFALRHGLQYGLVRRLPGDKVRMLVDVRNRMLRKWQELRHRDA